MKTLTFDQGAPIFMCSGPHKLSVPPFHTPGWLIRGPPCPPPTPPCLVACAPPPAGTQRDHGKGPTCRESAVCPLCARVAGQPGVRYRGELGSQCRNERSAHEGTQQAPLPGEFQEDKQGDPRRARAPALCQVTLRVSLVGPWSAPRPRPNAFLGVPVRGFWTR